MNFNLILTLIDLIDRNEMITVTYKIDIFVKHFKENCISVVYFKKPRRCVFLILKR